MNLGEAINVLAEELSRAPWPEWDVSIRARPSGIEIRASKRVVCHGCPPRDGVQGRGTTTITADGQDLVVEVRSAWDFGVLAAAYLPAENLRRAALDLRIDIDRAVGAAKSGKPL